MAFARGSARRSQRTRQRWVSVGASSGTAGADQDDDDDRHDEHLRPAERDPKDRYREQASHARLSSRPTRPIESYAAGPASPRGFAYDPKPCPARASPPIRRARSHAGPGPFRLPAAFSGDLGRGALLVPRPRWGSGHPRAPVRPLIQRTGAALCPHADIERRGPRQSFPSVARATPQSIAVAPEEPRSDCRARQPGSLQARHERAQTPIVVGQ